MTDNDMQSEAPAKRRPGRPSVDLSEIIFARVTPATAPAVRREADKRGTAPSALVREALDLLLNEANARVAA